MAGHSHWAQIKHKKAKIDAQKGKLFSKLIREITVAAKLGDPNPDANPRLRAAIEAARKVNMPIDTIERAIQKGSGNQEGANLEEIIYEGYGPSGVALMIKATTDNKNRTTSEVRHILSKHGGNLGSSGCVSYLFDQKGIIELPKNYKEEELLEKIIEAGAEDLETREDSFIVYTAPSELYTVKEKLEKMGIEIESVKLTFIPSTTIEIKDQDTAKKIINLIEKLEELDDVQEVIANFDISPDIMESLS